MNILEEMVKRRGMADNKFALTTLKRIVKRTLPYGQMPQAKTKKKLLD